MARWRSLLATAVLIAGGPPAAEALLGGASVLSMPLMDTAGNETPLKFVPPVLQNCLRQYPAEDFRREMGVKKPALVLAMLHFPADERDLRVASALVGASSGSRRFCEDIPGAVALGLVDFNESVELQVQKVGYQTVRIEIPIPPHQGNTLIWMGTIPMQRLDPSVEAVWALPLVDAQGLPASYTALPVPFYNCLEDLRAEAFRSEAGVKAPAMLLAVMEFPADETDWSISPTLTGTERPWQRYCANVPGAVALGLTEFDQPVGLRVEKLGYETVRATLPIDASSGNTLIWMGRLSMKRRDPSVRSAWSLPVIDGEGRPVDKTALPEPFYRCLRQLSVDDFLEDTGDKSPAMVLAALRFPADEPDVDVGSSLRGARHGWWPFCAAERGHVALGLIDFEQPVELQVHKPGYRTLRAAVPIPPNPGTTLIWLGELAMERMEPSYATEISGDIENSRHRVADMVDRITLQMRHSTRKQRCKFSDTAFVCQPVTAGDYLVEFWRGSGLVHTWWVSVPEDLTQVYQRFIAKTSARLPVRISAWPPGLAPAQELVLEVNDQATIITLAHDEWLHVSQVGPLVQFASAELPLVVCQGALQGLDRLERCVAEARVRPPGDSWRGLIQPGDVVALLREDGQPATALEVLGYDWAVRLDTKPAKP